MLYKEYQETGDLGTGDLLMNAINHSRREGRIAKDVHIVPDVQTTVKTPLNEVFKSVDPQISSNFTTNKLKKAQFTILCGLTV